MSVSVAVSLIYLLLGFLMGSLAGAGMSWLYAIMTFFKRIEKMLKDIKPIEKDELDNSERERFRRYIAES